MPDIKKIPEKDIPAWKAGLKTHKGLKGPGGFKFAQEVRWNGKVWVVYDFDADSTAPGGFTLVLVRPDFSETVRGVCAGYCNC